MKPSREEIKDAARQCGIDVLTGWRDDDSIREYYEAWPEQLERFAVAMYEAGAAECGKLLAEQDSEYNRKTNAMITRHSNQLAAERAVSDKLLDALKDLERTSAIGFLYDDPCRAKARRLIAEVEAMRKEQK